jgi:hypothetical protein
MPGVLTMHPDDSANDGPRSTLVRKQFLPWEAPRWPSALERSGVNMESSAQRCKQLSTCCAATVLRMSFSC